MNNGYAKLFEDEFNKIKKESLFVYSLVFLTIVDGKDIEIFEKEKKNWENRKERILFHGTNIKPSGLILINMFKKSEKAHYQFGKGVYFTDMLDYCWYYGWANSSREKANKMPNIGETFTSDHHLYIIIKMDLKGFMIIKKTQKKWNKSCFGW